MSKKTRAIIFFILFFIFLFVGAYLFLIANGYLINWKNWPRVSLTKTGAILLNFYPRDAQIKINQKIYPPQKELFFNDVLISSLLPGNYEVEIFKEGYALWKKNLEVKPKTVSSATKIRLFPSSIFWQSPLTEKINDFWLTKQGLVYQTKENELKFKNMKLKGKMVLANVDNKNIITTQMDNYFLTDLEKPNAAINLNELFASLTDHFSKIKGVYFHPFNPDKIIIGTERNFYTIDLSKIKLEFLTRAPFWQAAAIGTSELIFIDKNGELYIFNLLLQTLASKSLSLKEVSILKISPEETKIGLQTNNGDLFVFNRLLNEVKLIALEIKDFYFSPDGKKVFLIFRNGETKIFYLEPDEKDNEKIQKGTMLPSGLDNFKEVSQFDWLFNGDDYLILGDKKLIMAELDFRPPLYKQILYLKTEKYFLDDKTIYLLDKDGEFLKGEIE